ncbi:MAG: hypothetical protein R3F43_10165 [bacterium]
MTPFTRMLAGALAGLGGAAGLDAALTLGLPALAGFLPLWCYLAGAVLGAAGGLLARRLGRALWLLALIGVGGLAAAGLVMPAQTPAWESKAGWQACRLIAGPWYLRSPVPVATPGCATLAMCANESAWWPREQLAAHGCPEP